MKMAYQWKMPIYNVDAQEAGEYLETFDEVTPENVLEQSRPADALLHDCFEWDDSTAAEKYRLKQASKLIRNLSVTYYEDSSSEPKEVRAYHSVTSHDKKADYRPVQVVLSDETMREQVLENALAELERFRRKYEGILAFDEILREYYNRQAV